MGALEAPQDKHGQEHRTGTSRAEQTDRGHGGAGSSGSHGGCRELRWPWQGWELWRPWRSWELWRPWQMVFGALASVPLGPAPTAGTHTTPQKKFPGEVRGGIRSPPGLNRQDSTKQDRKALQGQTDRTGQPTGSPPGLARRLRLLLGMTRSQGPSQGPSATASTSATRGQAAGMASLATTRGTACLRRVSMDLQDLDMVS